MNRLSSRIVRPNAAPPHYVLLGIAGVKVEWTALIESCDIATKRKPALVVLVHVQVSILDASKWRRSPAVPAGTVTAVLRVSESESETY